MFKTVYALSDATLVLFFVVNGVGSTATCRRQ